jgi:hypothetical protein
VARSCGVDWIAQGCGNLSSPRLAVEPARSTASETSFELPDFTAASFSDRQMESYQPTIDIDRKVGKIEKTG